MSFSDEMVDAKQLGKDVNINLNDSLVEGEPKTPPFSQNPSENGKPKAEEKDDAAIEQQIPAEKAVSIPHAKSPETSFDNKATKSDTGTNIQQNATTSDNFQADDSRMLKDVSLNFEGNAKNGANENDIDADAKELCNAKVEDIHAHVLNEKSLETKAENDDKFQDDKKVEALKDVSPKMDLSPHGVIKKEMPKSKLDEAVATLNTPNKSFLVEPASFDGYESGTEDEQAEFAKEVESFYKENNLEFKAPKFYKEELNLLKLWREVIKLGGYEQVTSCKLWRQVGESFKPPKTCTTVSWTFRIFYEKALLEYEKHKMRCGELPFSDDSLPEPIRVENQTPGSQALGSGRARRDAAARAMQGWHSQRLLGNGQLCDPIIKDKNLNSTSKGDKLLKTNGLLKRKKPSSIEQAVHISHIKTMKLQAGTMVIDIGPPADWVKINVQRTNDCFEIYALVPGLLREEVHVQSDPAGRLIISGQPEQRENPWGVTPFKKVVSLPSRIDPHQTSAVVTLHGQLFVRVPFEQPDI